METSDSILKCFEILGDTSQGLDDYRMVILAHDAKEAVEIWNNSRSYKGMYSLIRVISDPSVICKEPYTY